MLELKNRVIEANYSLGRKTQVPEGLITAALRRSELTLAGLMGSRERDEELKQKVEELFYRPEPRLDQKKLKRIEEDLEDEILDGQVSEPGSYHFIDDTGLEFSEIDGFQELASDRKLRNLLENYFGSDVRVEHAASGWTEPSGEESKGIEPDLWHLDRYQRGSKTRCFIFISDESGRNAPLQVVDRRDTVKIMSDYGVDELNENPEIVEERCKIHGFKGSTGDFLIFNPSTHLHRATKPTQGERMRKTLMIDFVPGLL